MLISSDKVYAADEELDFDYAGKVVTDTGELVIVTCAEKGTYFILESCNPVVAYPTSKAVKIVTKKGLDKLIDEYELDKKTGKVAYVVYKGETYVVKQVAETYVDIGLDDFMQKYAASAYREKMVLKVNELSDSVLKETANVYVKSGLDDFVTNMKDKNSNIINR